MPHLAIDLSRNVAQAIDLDAFCQKMHAEMVACTIFPLGGIRVRAHIADAQVTADGLAENGYLDMVLRMGSGRSLDSRTEAGERLFATAKAYLAPLFQQPHFALSFEIREIDPALSWKENSIHPRLARAAKGA